MRLGPLLIPIGVMGMLAGGGYLFRQHELAVGDAAYLKADYKTAFKYISPFGGWFDPVAEAYLSSIYLNGSSVARDDQKAFALARKSAGGGSSRGEYFLSTLYQQGLGIPKDAARAAYWAQRGATERFVPAEALLGQMYEFGTGVAEDYVQAAKWFKDAAAEGNADAEVGLGDLYDQGLGVPQDEVFALKYYADAASQYDTAGQYKLGMMELNGAGTPPDTAAAVSQLTAAAIGGSADAQFLLGTLYAGLQPPDGQPLLEDDALAYALYNLAAGQGNLKANEQRDTLQQRMTADEVASAQMMSADWQVGSPLPKSTLEDFATQALIQTDRPAGDIVANTSVWFSTAFTLHKHSDYAVFLASAGTDADDNDCHACGARISAVTFEIDGPPSAVEPYVVDANFTQSGSFGKVATLADNTAPFDAPRRTNALYLYLGADQYAVLMPSEYYGMGETNGFDQMLVYDDQYSYGPGGWHDAGTVDTSDDTSDNCDSSGKPEDGAAPCFTWTGKVHLVRKPGSKWPEFVVEVSGTSLSSFPKKAPNIIYAYNGQTVKQINPPPAD